MRELNPLSCPLHHKAYKTRLIEHNIKATLRSFHENKRMEHKLGKKR
jgi:hypothetical protein